MSDPQEPVPEIKKNRSFEELERDFNFLVVQVNGLALQNMRLINFLNKNFLAVPEVNLSESAEIFSDLQLIADRAARIGLTEKSVRDFWLARKGGEDES